MKPAGLRHWLPIITKFGIVVLFMLVCGGIIFPVIQAARPSAGRTLCLSNAKQLGLAFTMYLQDYDERAPRVINNASAGTRSLVSGLKPVQGDSVFKLTRPYNKIDVDWRCPEDKTVFDTQSLNTNGSLSPANASSYQMNFYLTGETVDALHGKTSGEGLLLSKVNHPETTVLFRDGDSNDGTNIWNNTEVGGAVIGANLYTTHSDHAQSMRHEGEGNYTFCDGHAKRFKPEEVSPMKVSDDPQKPCPDCPDKVDPKAKVFFNIVK